MTWLGSKRGYLSDWVTQRWVHFTARRLSLSSAPGPSGPRRPHDGLTCGVLLCIAPATDSPRLTAWFRRLRGSGNVLYAGFYSVCTLPGRPDPSVKIVFPLPNGNAIVIMRTECRADGSFVVTSE